jgi:hypothetical protein
LFNISKDMTSPKPGTKSLPLGTSIFCGVSFVCVGLATVGDDDVLALPDDFTSFCASALGASAFGASAFGISAFGISGGCTSIGGGAGGGGGASGGGGGGIIGLAGFTGLFTFVGFVTDFTQLF